MLAPVPAHPRRLVFLGTPDLAVPSLRALVGAGFEVALVVTRPDKRRGRGGKVAPSPVKAAAEELGIPATHTVDDVLSAEADLGVVVAYGRLVRRPVLEAVPMVNVHFSLLPRWRGAAPVERAILAGDDQTGVAIMQLEEELDTGPVFAVERVAIGPDETADEMRTRLAAIGADLLVATLTTGLGAPEPQTGEPTYAAKIEPEELRLDWSRPAVELHRTVRLGRAWTTFRDQRLRVLEARPGPPSPLRPGELDGTSVGTGEGTLELVAVQPEGRGRQRASDWRNGARPAPGERLGG